jgi:hypothetical protein
VAETPPPAPAPEISPHPTTLKVQQGTQSYTYGGPNLLIELNYYELLRMIDDIRNERDRAPRSDWFIASAGIFVSVVLVAQTADFKNVLSIAGSDWKVVWSLVAFVSLAGAAVQGCRLAWHWKKHPMRTSEQIYEERLAAHEKQMTDLEAIQKKYPKASEVLSTPKA